MAGMTLEDKMTMLHGIPLFDKPYSASVAPLEKLGIPRINVSDGPQCWRHENEKHARTSTQFPSELSIAASWDEEATYKFGEAMG